MPNRSALVQGPAKVVFNAPSGAITFHSQGPIAYTIGRRTLPITTEMHGQIDVRDQDVNLETSIKPEGRWSAGLISALWPYANSPMGAALFSDTDRTLVLHGTDGALHTWTAAAVTKMPDLLFSPMGTLIGEVGFTGLAGNNLAWSAANRLLTIGTLADSVDATFTVAGIKVQSYSAVLTGLTGFTSFESADGFRVAFALQTSDQSIDSQGVYNKLITGVSVAVRCIPVGPTSAQLMAALKMQDTGAARGRSLDAGGVQLQITGADGINYLTIPHASIETGQFRFGAGTNQLRVGEIAIVATRSFSAGAQQALWTLAAA